MRVAVIVKTLTVSLTKPWRLLDLLVARKVLLTHTRATTSTSLYYVNIKFRKS